jgi:hypothetical protein
MIKVVTKHGEVRVDGVVNNNKGFDCPWYLIGIGMGFETMMFLVKSMEGCALDEWADGKYAHLTAISQEDLKDYIQEGRKHYIESMELLKNIIDGNKALNDSDFLANNAIQELNDIAFEVEQLIESISKYKDGHDWDSNGPYDIDQVSYLGNYSNMHDLTELRIFEKVANSQINWFAKKD